MSVPLDRQRTALLVMDVQADIVAMFGQNDGGFLEDLDVILRARGVDTLLLAGIATSGIVLSTACHAADADYRLAIVRDCCADRDEEVHRVLLDKVLVRRAATVTAEEAIASLS